MAGTAGAVGSPAGSGFVLGDAAWLQDPVPCPAGALCGRLGSKPEIPVFQC